jgi:hypothetical protein
MERDPAMGIRTDGRRPYRRADVRVWVEQLPEARQVRVSADELWVDLADGRRLAVPLRWFPWLAGASQQERRNWELVGNGIGINWPDLRQEVFVLDLCVPPATRAEEEGG